VIVRWAAKRAGVHSFAWIEGGRGSEIGRFLDGKNYYLLALAPYGQSPRFYAKLKETSTSRILEKRHVYDSREGTYLGFVDAWHSDHEKDLAKLFAALPYKVEALELEDPAPAKQGTIVRFPAKLVLAGGTAGRHVFRVDVTRPDGKSLLILGYNQEAPGGKAEIEVPLAYNAPVGKWKIMVSDVATGSSETTQLIVSRK
jgi:hypothetical protein